MITRSVRAYEAKSIEVFAEPISCASIRARSSSGE
jgi:hypothetical protein